MPEGTQHNGKPHGSETNTWSDCQPMPGYPGAQGVSEEGGLGKFFMTNLESLTCVWTGISWVVVLCGH